MGHIIKNEGRMSNKQQPLSANEQVASISNIKLEDEEIDAFKEAYTQQVVLAYMTPEKVKVAMLKAYANTSSIQSPKVSFYLNLDLKVDPNLEFTQRMVQALNNIPNVQNVTIPFGNITLKLRPRSPIIEKEKLQNQKKTGFFKRLLSQKINKTTIPAIPWDHSETQKRLKQTFKTAAESITESVEILKLNVDMKKFNSVMKRIDQACSEITYKADTYALSAVKGQLKQLEVTLGSTINAENWINNPSDNHKQRLKEQRTNVEQDFNKSVILLNEAIDEASLITAETNQKINALSQTHVAIPK